MRFQWSIFIANCFSRMGSKVHEFITEYWFKFFFSDAEEGEEEEEKKRVFLGSQTKLICLQKPNLNLYLRLEQVFSLLPDFCTFGLSVTEFSNSEMCWRRKPIPYECSIYSFEESEASSVRPSAVRSEEEERKGRRTQQSVVIHAWAQT